MAATFSGLTQLAYGSGNGTYSTPADSLGIAIRSNSSSNTEFGTIGRLRGTNSGDTLGIATAQANFSTNFNLQNAICIYGLFFTEGSASQLETIANNGVFVGFGTDNSTEYKLFSVAGSDGLVPNITYFLIAPSQVADLASASPDESALSSFITGFNPLLQNNFNPGLSVGNVAGLSDPRLEGGSVGSPATLKDLSDILITENLMSVEVADNSNVFKLQIPLTISAETYSDELGTLVFESSSRAFIPTNFFYLRFNLPTATSSFLLSNRKIASAENLEISVTPGSDTTNSITLDAVTVEAPGVTTITSPMVWAGGADVNRTLVVYQSGAFSSRTFTNSDLQIDYNPGQNLSSLTGILANGSQLLLNPSATGASTDLSGLTSTSSITLDNLTAFDTTIAVSSGLNFTLANPTTGGGSITAEAPLNSIILNGIPDVPNAIVSVKNLTTDAVTYPTITGTSVTIITDANTNYEIHCDAPGYLLEAVTLPGNTPQFTFILTDYRSLYDSGVNRSADIQFDYNTLVVTIGDGTANLTFADIFHTIEDYLATPQGVLFDYPPFPVTIDTGSGVRNYLFFPEQGENLPNPVRIVPNPANTSDPTLTDFVIVLQEASAPLFDIFDFTAANGRIIRSQTEAVAANVVVSGSGALTTEQSTQLENASTVATRLDGLVENSNGDQFTTKALSQAPTGGGSITEQSIYDLFVAGSNTDPFKATGFSTLTASDVWASPTRTLTDKIDYGLSTASITAISAAIWSATTRALTDKANFELTPAQINSIASTTEAALIDENDGQQLINTLVQAINASLDLPVAEIQLIAQQVRTELAVELARIDADISSRLPIASYSLPLDSAATQSAVQLALTTQGYTPARAITIDTLASTTALNTGLSALQNHGDNNWTTATGFSTLSASDVRTELAVELESIESLAKGEFIVNSNGTATQYTPAGAALANFNLFNFDGLQADPTTQPVARRVPV